MRQVDVADRIGTSNVCICAYECGHRMPNLEKVSMLSDILDVSLDMLIPKADMSCHKVDDSQTNIYDMLDDGGE